MAALRAYRLHRFFHSGDQETSALENVSLLLEPGEFVAVTGPSGSGKSTLLSCLAGLDEPDGGYVEIAGRRITRRPEAERCAIRARHIGLLLQSGNLFDHLTVAANIQLQLDLAGIDDRLRPVRLLEVLGIDGRAQTYPSQLSGGEAARAGLAVAIAAQPDVLLADEPTAEVDAEAETRIIDQLVAHAGNGGAVLVVTHSTALAERARRMLRLEDGRLDHE